MLLFLLNNFDVVLLGVKRKAKEESDIDNKTEQKKGSGYPTQKKQLLTLESLFGQNKDPDMF